MATDERTTAIPPLTANDAAEPRGSAPLTPKAIEAAKPREKDYEVGDAGSGLRLRITARTKSGAGGARIFRWYTHDGGKRVIVTLGRWSPKPRPGFVTLAEARHQLERLKEAQRAGELREALEKLRPARPDPATDAAPLTVRQVASDFLEYIGRRRKRPEQARRPIEQDILPALGDRPIASITSRDVRQVVEAVVARGSPTQAGVCLAVAKQMFRFAIGRDDIAANPAAALDPGALGVVRNTCQRYLSPDEIAAFWKALDAHKSMTPTVKNGLRLLLLTGVRSGELLRATWDEIDLDGTTWTIPIAHQKLTRERERTARPWTVPLAPTALGVFQELRALASAVRSPYVMASFQASGGHISEKALNHAMRRLFTGKDPALTFAEPRPTPHDLRRSLRSHVGDKLGVPWHVGERLLNHSLGKIASTYDVGDYVKERRGALERWEGYIARLLDPSSTNVIPLPAARA